MAAGWLSPGAPGGDQEAPAVGSLHKQTHLSQHRCYSVIYWLKTWHTGPEDRGVASPPPPTATMSLDRKISHRRQQECRAMLKNVGPGGSSAKWRSSIGGQSFKRKRRAPRETDTVFSYIKLFRIGSSYCKWWSNTWAELSTLLLWRQGENTFLHQSRALWGWEFKPKYCNAVCSFASGRCRHHPQQ